MLRALPLAALFSLLGLVTFLEDGRYPVNVVLGSAAVLVIVLELVARPPELGRTVREGWPYVLWLALVGLGALLVDRPAAWDEWGRQVCWVGLVGAVASLSVPARVRSGLLASLIVLFGLVLMQISGPPVNLDTLGRAISYQSLMQWSGFPELGMLAALGAVGTAAVVLSARTVQLRCAAVVLAAGFVAAALIMYSRSALLTIALVVPWLGLLRMAGGRFRSRVLAGTVTLTLVVTAVSHAPAEAWRERDLGNGPVASGASQAERPSDPIEVRRRGWTTALAMVRDHPWMGIGPGMYPSRYPSYSAFDDPSHAYNILLHTAAEVGLIGLLGYLLVWWRVLIGSLRAALLRPEEGAPLAIHGMLLAFFVRSQSEHFLANLTTSFRVFLLTAVLFGLAEALRHKGAPERVPDLTS